MKIFSLILLFCAARASAALDARKVEIITGLAPNEKAGELPTRRIRASSS